MAVALGRAAKCVSGEGGSVAAGLKAVVTGGI